MKGVRQFLPPRQSVVYAHTRRMLDATASNYTTFAMDVAQRYLAMTAPDVRQVKLRTGEGADLIKAMENNAQILRRYMDGTVKTLPADLEDAWVMSLPEPFRGDCERDLARRRGMLAVQMPADDETAQAVGLARLAHEFGELMSALAPALADGKLDAADLPFARRILDESDDLISAVVALRRQVQALVPHSGVMA
ncbi:phage regulatory CII family protein [Stenotrophomonas sp. PS02298]|uniref:phage regulatory CII family protein n=1 Tax=Stenotrophomonas sp. PS02298 TaxID=2991424 RepID=UPI00249C6E29|nr:phage regulatory CII family protein [Stenotrophomonas sp. PS02298]